MLKSRKFYFLLFKSGIMARVIKRGSLTDFGTGHFQGVTIPREISSHHCSSSIVVIVFLIEGAEE